MCGVRSTSAKGRRSTKLPLSNSSAPRWRPTPQRAPKGQPGRSKSRLRVTMKTELLRFNGAVQRDPAIDAWMKEHGGELGAIAYEWFEVMRRCGDEVRELLHDGCPVACLGDAPFGYVNVFTS